MNYRNSLFLAIFCFITQAQTCHAAAKSKSAKEKEKKRYSRICGHDHPSLDNRGYKIIDSLRTFSSASSLEFSSSPQHKSMCWLIHEDKAAVAAGSQKMKERYALATLIFATSPEKWETKTNWLTKESVCQWYGITCDQWGHVVDIDLGFNALNGLVPSEIALLSYLDGLRLTANDLQGVIPTAIGHLSNLRVLQLNMNGFFGLIPTTIGKLTNLRELHLYGNYLDGSIPSEVGNMKNLEIFDGYANFFKGNIPKEIANMKSLKSLFLNDNELQGSFPSEICSLKLDFYVADCRGFPKEVHCKCCTHCCKDGENPRCKKVESQTATKKK